MDNAKRYLYSPRQIAAATFLGAPIAGCILLAHNFRQLGQMEMAKKVMTGGFIGTAILLVITFILPEKFPPSVLPIGYTFGMLAWVKQIQEKIYNEHIANGGARGSTGKVVSIGFGCLVALVIIIFLAVWILPPAWTS